MLLGQAALVDDATRLVERFELFATDFALAGRARVDQSLQLEAVVCTGRNVKEVLRRRVAGLAFCDVVRR